MVSRERERIALSRDLFSEQSSDPEREWSDKS